MKKNKQENWWDNGFNEDLYALLISFAMVVIDKPVKTGVEAVKTMNEIKRLFKIK